jgi:16S rRNA processing protein RimM
LKSSSSRLLVGRVGRAVGLKGEVELLVVSDAPDRFAPGAVVFHDERPLTVRTSRRRGDRTVIKFVEIFGRDDAEALTGAELTIPEDVARPLDEGEYWDHDLVGCDVVTTDGNTIGQVDDVLHQPAGEILAVGKHLIPMTQQVVKSVDRGVRITIDPPPGLLED